MSEETEVYEDIIKRICQEIGVHMRIFSGPPPLPMIPCEVAVPERLFRGTSTPEQLKLDEETSRKRWEQFGKDWAEYTELIMLGQPIPERLAKFQQHKWNPEDLMHRMGADEPIIVEDQK